MKKQIRVCGAMKAPLGLLSDRTVCKANGGAKLRQVQFCFTVLLLAVVLVACGKNAASAAMSSSSVSVDAAASATTHTDSPQSGFSQPADISADSKVLVAYFSRAGENYHVGVVEKGSTEILAELVAENTNGTLFHIETVNAYPESYEECKKVAIQERNSAVRPELAAGVEDFDTYDVIYLGYPIWYGDMPMAVYTFLESYDFTGKTIIPFCTHAGSGLAGTVNSIRAACKGATVLDGLAIPGTTVQKEPRKAQEQVNEFLNVS